MGDGHRNRSGQRLGRSRHLDRVRHNSDRATCRYRRGGASGWPVSLEGAPSCHIPGAAHQRWGNLGGIGTVLEFYEACYRRRRLTRACSWRRCLLKEAVDLWTLWPGAAAEARSVRPRTINGSSRYHCFCGASFQDEDHAGRVRSSHYHSSGSQGRAATGRRAAESR